MAPPKKRSFELLLEESSDDEKNDVIEILGGSSSEEEDEDDDYDDGDDESTLHGSKVSTQRSSISSKLSPGADLSTQQPTPGLGKERDTSTASKNKKRSFEVLLEESSDDEQKKQLLNTKAPPPKRSPTTQKDSRKSPAKDKTTPNQDSSTKKQAAETTAPEEAEANAGCQVEKEVIDKKRQSAAENKPSHIAKAIASRPKDADIPKQKPSKALGEAAQETTQNKSSNVTFKSTTKKSRANSNIEEPSSNNGHTKTKKKKSKSLSPAANVQSNIKDEGADSSKPKKKKKKKGGEDKKHKAGSSKVGTTSSTMSAELKPAATMAQTSTSSSSSKSATAEANPSDKKIAADKSVATTKQGKGQKSANKQATSAAASKPKKKKKLNFQDNVFRHMLFALKPFTLKSLAKELSSTEAQLNYCILSLIDKDLVLKKDFTSAKGRTKTLYFANQDGKAKEVNISLASPQEIFTAKQELGSLKSQEASVHSALTSILETPSNEQLTAQVTREENELKELKQRLDKMKERIRDSSKLQQQPSKLLGYRGPVKSAAQLARERCPRRMKIRINNMRTVWKKRKETTTDFVDKLADGLEKKPKDVMKLLDLETDEMMGVTMPSKHVVDEN